MTNNILESLAQEVPLPQEGTYAWTDAPWHDWKWQQKHKVTDKDIPKLRELFPDVSNEAWNQVFGNSLKRLKFQVTPYMLSKILKNQSKNTKNPDESFLNDIWVKQFFPSGDIKQDGPGGYDAGENWELSEEFPTPNLHHKYTNRAPLRTSTCFSYCNFCFEAKRTLDKNPQDEKIFRWSDWKASQKYIRKNKQLEEIIFSGGEPLILSNNRLEKIFSDIVAIENEQERTIYKRIHTRVLSHNPFRITPEFAEMIGKYGVNQITFDVAHADEITPEFIHAVNIIRDSAGVKAPMLALHTPLLKGVNDDTTKLWDLFSKAYKYNIRPYYLLCPMPNSPLGDDRISVADAVELYSPLKRHKSNNVIPELVIVDKTGKQTVPLERNGTPEFQYKYNTQGNPIIHFKNWKGEWNDYADVPSTIAKEPRTSYQVTKSSPTIRQYGKEIVNKAKEHLTNVKEKYF